MASVPVPNVVEVEVRGTMDDVPVENTLYFQFVGTLTNILIQALAVALQTWFVDNVLPTLAEGYVFKEVYARDLSAGSGLNGIANSSGGTPGGVAETGLPGNVAFVIKFLTAFAGRSFRGRNYIPGMTPSIVAGNLMDVSAANAFKGFYEMLLGGGGVLPDDWTWGVVSRVSGGAPRVTGLFTPIGAVSYTDLLVDTQRKRLT